MGLFDYIHSEYPLPSCPQALIDRWGKSVGDIAFQTKDTPDQVMASYVISSKKQLLVNRKEYEWVDTPEKADENASQIQAWVNRGYNKVVREWQEPCGDFSGIIHFYTNYMHADNKTVDCNQDTFADGWVEYEALFQNGQLIQIDQHQHTLPVKYTPQEIADRELQHAAAIRDNHIQQHAHRHEHPSPEQKLIDAIDAAIIEDCTIFDIEDLEIKLSQIQKLINEYRTKHDRWYTQS